MSGIIAHLIRRASENNVENCFAVFLSRFQGRRVVSGDAGTGGERFVCFPSITRTFSPRGYRACPFLRAVHPARLQSRRIIESAASRPTGLGCTRIARYTIAICPPLYRESDCKTISSVQCVSKKYYYI